MNYPYITHENYYLLQDEKLTALFVNTTENPINYIPYDNYQAVKLGENNYEFFRLYELVYLCDGSIKYSVFKFLPIEVKPHLKEIMYCHIKLIEGCKEFLL